MSFGPTGTGIPCAIIPFFGDQYFWGNRIHQLEFGPKPIPILKLSEKKFEKTLNNLIYNENYKINTKKIQTKILNENGVEKAAYIINDFINNLGKNKN